MFGLSVLDCGEGGLVNIFYERYLTTYLPYANLPVDLHYEGIKGKRKGSQKMLKIIGKDTLPVQARGKAGTVSVAVRENGQIGFSTLAGAVFDNYTSCLIQWDDEERNMIFTPMHSDKPAKGVKAAQLYTVGMSKDGKARYISAAGLFKDDSVAYDYKTAGTHSFPAVIENGKLSFELPTAMEPKPKKTRTLKAAKGAAVGNGSATGSTTGTPELEEA